jgi:hypothetical protein
MDIKGRLEAELYAVLSERNAQVAEVERLTAEIVEAHALFDQLQELLRGTGANRYWEARWRDEAAENEQLRTALQALVADIEEYERINNLAPSPGKQDCWQTITQAKAILRLTWGRGRSPRPRRRW